MAAAATISKDHSAERILSRLQVGEIIGVAFQGRPDPDSYRIVALFNDQVLSAFASLAPRYRNPKELVGKKIIAMTLLTEEIAAGARPHFQLLSFLDQEKKIQLIHPRSDLLKTIGKTTQAGSFLYPLDSSKSPIRHEDFEHARIHCGTIREILELTQSTFRVELDMGELGTRYTTLEDLPLEIVDGLRDTQVAVVLLNPNSSLADSESMILTAPLENGQRVPLGIDAEGEGVVPNGANLAFA